MFKYILIGLLACTISYADINPWGTPEKPKEPNSPSTPVTTTRPTPAVVTPLPIPTAASSSTLYTVWVNAVVHEHNLHDVSAEEAPKVFRDLLQNQLQELIKLNQPAAGYRTPVAPLDVRRQRTVEFIGLATAAIGLLYIDNPSSELSRSLNRPLSNFYHRYLYNKSTYIVAQTLAFILAANSTDISSVYATALGLVASFSASMVVQDLINSSDATNEERKPARLEALALAELKSIVDQLASAGINFNELGIDSSALHAATRSLFNPQNHSSKTLFAPLCEALLTPATTTAGATQRKVRVVPELELAEEPKFAEVHNTRGTNRTSERE